MKKSLIALAVAGAIAVPSIATADATLYGSFRMGMTDQKNNSLVLEDVGSRVGIKGTVDLGLQDTQGIFLWEQALDLNSAALDNGRYAYVGATGSWGTALAGKIDHPSVTMVSDYTDFSWNGDYASVGQQYHAKQGNTLAYVSPEFSGVQFVVGGVFAGDALSEQAPANLPADQKDRAVDGYNMGVQYDANGIYAAVAYGNVKSGKSNVGTYGVNQNVWGLAAGFSGIENLDLRASYERLRDKTGASEVMDGDEGKANAWNIAANYDIDNTSIYGMYGRVKLKPVGEEDGKGRIYTLGVSHAMGNGAVFAEFVNYGKDLKEENGRYTTVGYVLNF